MENINFEDFKGQCEAAGIYGLTNIIVEWLNYQNMTYDVFVELTRRYSRMTDCERENLTLPFADKSFS